MNRTVNRAPQALMCVLFAALPFCAVEAGVPSSDSVPLSEWPVVGRTGDNHHFSPLRQVNDKNVNRLGLAWYADIPSKPGLVGTPIVVDGVVYQSAQRSVVFANDVRTGRLLWTFDPKLKFKGEMIPTMGSHVNRGVGVWKDKVYVGTGDCRLIAINRTTGKPAWEADVCVGDSRFAITGAPRVAAGKVFIGPANLDDGSRRGFLDAYDAETGKRLWRFYTVPGDPSKGFENKAMEMASKTWGKDYWKRAGSGSVIEGITYDPVLKLVYFGTTSASPDLPQDRGEGRNGELFTASIVAVDADTGEYRWHYQQTPNNGWNYDSYQPITIATLPIGGKQRRVLMHAPKNGFFYVLDASTGKLLAADKYGVRVNWASSVDVKTGRPREMQESQYWVTGHSMSFPSSYGAHNWMPMAFSPLTGLVYIPAVDMGEALTYAPALKGKGVGFALVDSSVEREMDLKDAKAPLIAWDPVKRKVRWKVDEPLPVGGGTLATAGNLVFYGRGDGLLRAFAADTGKVLWSVQLDGAVRAAPITVEVDGEQVVLISSGSDGSSGGGVALGDVNTTEATRHAPARLLAFKIGGTAKLPATDLSGVFREPARPRPDAEGARLGRALVISYACDYCHGGPNLQATMNNIPDLRMANAATHAALDKIVIGGAYEIKGMPRFPDMPPEDLERIRAYILDRAWAAYDAQQAAKAAPGKP